MSIAVDTLLMRSCDDQYYVGTLSLSFVSSSLAVRVALFHFTV